MPYIHLFGIDLPSYELFVSLALIAGVAVYYYESRRVKKDNERSFYLAFAALLGGAIGAKIPHWIMNYQLIIESWPDVYPLLAGRTIVGGLIGGTLAVYLTRKKLGIKHRHGNLFAPAGAIGIAIGRIGCFLRGCCYGTETNLPWGVDFGDSIMRHPTQIYESIFALGMFVYFQFTKKKAKPGYQFWQLLVFYFSYRFLSEFIRTEPKMFLDLTSFQYVSLLMLVWLFRGHIIRLYEKIKMHIHKYEKRS